MIGIYKITSPSKKVYIGQSINVKSRLSHYKRLDCKKQTKIYNSLKKYGSSSHKFEILCECTREELNDLEAYYIELYQSFNSEFGLNLREGGNCFKVSEETKIKISESKKGEKNHMFGTKGFWFGKKRESLNKGRKHTEESKKLISLHSKNRIVSDETKEKHRKYKTGLKMSEESKLKLSKSKKGIILTEEHKKNISLSTKGKPWTENRRNAQKLKVN